MEIITLEKSKCILWRLTIKYNLPLGKPKRTELCFPKRSTVLNTILSITI